MHIRCQTSEFCFHLVINSEVVHGRCKKTKLTKKISISFILFRRKVSYHFWPSDVFNYHFEEFINESI